MKTMYAIWYILSFAIVIGFAQSLIIEYEGTHNIFNAKFVNVDLELLNNTDANYTYNGYKVLYTNKMFLSVGLDDSIMPSNDKREITKDTREEWTNVIQLGPNFVKSLSNVSYADVISEPITDYEVAISGLHITERYRNIDSSDLNVGSTFNNIVKSFGSAADALASSIYGYETPKECGMYTTQHGDTWFQIHTCTTGRDCDAISSLKIVEEAVEEAVAHAHALADEYPHKSYRGSFTMNHGGTWDSCVEYYQKDYHEKSFPGCPPEWCN
ncbi:predicted protein [Meyerozyma guilliermondii ATCC 6260]|uniref:Secreted protein CSS2 C-terminal domain-containing protein n=1 Tax=Meyerozyma guilliermondii (strain ATCC 6260 / CBS 566 / DSM 6381 / JCM 1539 / NBRC 10279 / NRRL Y-324) TaxID=294746 RepID=A5DCC8_PICGU|nr:uncharacterized protein PGUG_00933 [Meyerozyma guilliermondii ATCC 6260]EDK36835.2 predicted protein [Meyerozyma guilliermondii ATCC 6260]